MAVVYARWACSLRAVRSARTHPTTSTSAKYHLARGADGLQKYADFWGNTLLPGYGDGGGLAVHPLRGRRHRRDRAGGRRPRALLRRSRGGEVEAPTDDRADDRRHERRERDRHDAHRRRPETGTGTGCCRRELGLCPCGCIGKRSKGSFVAKTLAGASGVHAPGDLQRGRSPRSAACCSGIDARVKLVDDRRRCWSSVGLARSLPRAGRGSTRSPLGLAAASRAAGRLLHQAGLAVHPDLHRHRGAAGHAVHHHARARRR